MILVIPKNFLLILPRFIDGSAQNSGQRLDNVNRTHLVLASGKLVRQKTLFPFNNLAFATNLEAFPLLPLFHQDILQKLDIKSQQSLRNKRSFFVRMVSDPKIYNPKIVDVDGVVKMKSFDKSSVVGPFSSMYEETPHNQPM